MFQMMELLLLIIHGWLSTTRGPHYKSSEWKNLSFENCIETDCEGMCFIH